MLFETLLISGPAGGGKTTVAHLVADHVLKRDIHYLRLSNAVDGHTNVVEPLSEAHSEDSNGWASMHRVTYTADRVFETIPEGLRAVRKLDRRGFAIVEADSDPAVRHAFPFDYRVFVMTAPPSVDEVFREPRDAAVALREVMQDTAAFASEVFGVFDAEDLDDSAGVEHCARIMRRDTDGTRQRIEQLDIGETQLHQFLGSTIGVEIAARIQLQPEYHPLVEADAVVINRPPGMDCAKLDECVMRIEKLLTRIRHDAREHSVLYWGDVTKPEEPAHQQLVQRLKCLLRNTG